LARNRRLWKGVIIAAAVAITGLSHGQPAPEPPPAVEKAPASIPLADVVTESELLLTVTRDIEADLSADQSAETVAQRLPGISREIDARLRENRKIVAQSPSIEMLRGLQGEWSRLRRELAGLNRDLTSRLYELERHIARLDDFAKTWGQTLAAAKDGSVPPEVLSGIASVIAEIRQAREAVDKQRARALTLQSRVGAQDSRIADALMSVDRSREKALDRLFLRDSAPLWSAALTSPVEQPLQQEILHSFSRQGAALRAYVERQGMRFVLAGLIFLALAAALFWVRRRARELPADEAAFARAARGIEMPAAAALLVTLIASRWIFPQAPRLLWALFGTLALVPSVMILRRIMASSLHPALYALTAFFFFDQLRALAAAVPFLPRVLFLSEMLAVAVLSLWLLGFFGRPDETRSRKAMRIAGCLGLAIASAAFVANILGYITLASLLGNALLRSAYLALILYAMVEVLSSLVTVALSLRPFAALGTLRRHRLLLCERVRLTLYSVAILLWVLALLERLLLRDWLFGAARELLTAELIFGSIQFSPGDVLAFAITVWAAFLVSRFVRFLLDEDVYPRVRLKRGLSYAISNTLHYLILVVGFFLAVAALGFDMTRVTILAGAFSVGVGFGLQNVFNNFISGLILLFERPINIGDVVQIEDASGVVERIGVRASIIRTANGSEIIMPNGKLIAERLINWTLSSRRHGIELPIAVAQGNDPRRVISLLERTAAGHPLITGDPPPQALVVKLGPDSLGLELRAWTEHSEQWMQIRSEMAIAVNAALAAEKISIR
jgi:small-conductance mechanosensitive channel